MTFANESGHQLWSGASADDGDGSSAAAAAAEKQCRVW